MEKISSDNLIYIIDYVSQDINQIIKLGHINRDWFLVVRQKILKTPIYKIFDLGRQQNPKFIPFQPNISFGNVKCSKDRLVLISQLVEWFLIIWNKNNDRIKYLSKNIIDKFRHLIHSPIVLDNITHQPYDEWYWIQNDWKKFFHFIKKSLGRLQLYYFVDVDINNYLSSDNSITKILLFKPDEITGDDIRILRQELENCWESAYYDGYMYGYKFDRTRWSDIEKIIAFLENRIHRVPIWDDGYFI